MISAEELRNKLVGESVNLSVNTILTGIEKTLLKLKPGNAPIFTHTFTGYTDEVRIELTHRLKKLGYTVTINKLTEFQWTLILTWQ